jgi:methyl-accepting chemotaxis protein
LNRIVDVATQVAEIVDGINIASKEQSLSINQVNQGLVEVSQVVQVNSATSEESASASEELSSQAELLKRQVEKFRIRQMGFSAFDSSAAFESAPAFEETNERENKKKSRHSKEDAADATIILNDKEFGKY